MSEITIYSTPWCSDCHRTKRFLNERGVTFREINIEEVEAAEAVVLRVNEGRRRVPTIEVDGRFFSCSPFDPYKLADELNIPLNK